jgi:uncharacterized repeat protein (TIGR01451 family)
VGRVAGRRARFALTSVALVAAMLSSSAVVGVAPATATDSWTFVQVQRVNSFALQFGTDAYATQNAFGGAFGSLTQANVQAALDASVADGSMTWLLEMPGLTDLSGTSNGPFAVGFVGGAPVSDADNPATYDGHSDLDWWYIPDASGVGADGTPIEQLTASFTAGTFDAGPGPVTLTINLLGVDTALAMSNTHLQAVAGDSSAPLTSTNGLPPGHDPGENLPEWLTSFESMSSGKLIGGISARSLYSAYVPASIAQQCAQYDISHTLLDLFVGGCTTAIFFPVIRATQPDTFDPATGSGTYRFTFDTSTHRVTGCTRDGAAALLADCLDQAAYSTYFHFTTDRVIDLETRVLWPEAGVSPASLDFGDVPVGSPSASQQVTVTNTAAAGAGDLHIGQLMTTGANASSFGLGADQCSNTSLAPGASCTLVVTFLPTARGAASATLQVPDDAADSPQSVALSGTGVGPVAEVTPSSIDFGAVAVGTTSAPRTVTITNTGDTGQDLVLTADSITGPNAGDFAFVSERCVTSGVLAAGSSCTIELSFTPSASGIRTATLSITDNAADSPQTVSLTGTGATPSADLSVSIAARLTKAKGVSAVTYTITVFNAGPSMAAQVLVNDVLSSETTFVSATATDGACVTPVTGASGVVSCSLASLSSGSSSEIQIVVTVIARKTSITNTVTVSSTTSDPNLVNNTASISTRVK